MRRKRDITEDGSIDDVFFMPMDGVAVCVNFHKYLLSHPNTIMNFGGKANSSPDLEEFGKNLNDIMGYIRDPYSETEFAISQEKGQWFGTGLQTYFYALKNQEERYQRDYNGRKEHGNETAIAIAPLKKNGFIAFSSQPIRPQHNLQSERKKSYRQTRKLYINFLTDGVPLNSKIYQDISDVFGVNLGTATRCKSISMRAKWNIADRPQSFTMEPEGYYSTDTGTIESELEYAQRALIPNPFREHPNLMNSLKFERDFNRREIEGKNYMKEPLAIPERFVMDLKDRPYIDDPQTYKIHDFEAHINTGLTVGFGHININCNGPVLEELK